MPTQTLVSPRRGVLEDDGRDQGVPRKPGDDIVLRWASEYEIDPGGNRGASAESKRRAADGKPGGSAVAQPGRGAALDAETAGRGKSVTGAAFATRAGITLRAEQARRPNQVLGRWRLANWKR